MQNITTIQVLEMDVPLSELVSQYYNVLHREYGEEFNEYLKDVVRDAITRAYIDKQIDDNIALYRQPRQVSRGKRSETP